MRSHYVYEVLWPVGMSWKGMKVEELPCYVGKGCDRTRRAERNFKRDSNPYLAVIARESGVPLVTRIVARDLEAKEAFDLEQQLIEKYKMLSKGGTLVNQKEGNGFLPPSPSKINKFKRSVRQKEAALKYKERRDKLLRLIQIAGEELQNIRKLNLDPGRLVFNHQQYKLLCNLATSLKGFEGVEIEIERGYKLWKLVWEKEDLTERQLASRNRNMTKRTAAWW